MNRYLTKQILEDLNRKMVILGGPRQVGKTTIAKKLMGQFESDYLNWDSDLDRKKILNQSWSDTNELLIFDEIHKYSRWKNWLKGVYDKSKEIHKILVTGSARMDIYRKGGDSLLGRYHYLRLMPLSLSEHPEDISATESLDRLMNVSNFPEPFLLNDQTFARRWRNERLIKIIKEDIRDIAVVKDLSLLTLFFDQLRNRVSSQIVLSNIARDLEIAPKTAKEWLTILENMYLVFSVYPYSKKGSRLISKAPKVFMYDSCDTLGDDGARFENLVALELLKYCNYIQDTLGYRMELQYLRDREGHEVDFIILQDRKVIELIEVKLSDDTPSKSLKYFSKQFDVPCTQIVKDYPKTYKKDKLTIINPIKKFEECLR